MASERVITVGKLGSVVTIAYASTYYLLAILANDRAQSLSLAASTVFWLLAGFAGVAFTGADGRLIGRVIKVSVSLSDIAKCTKYSPSDTFHRISKNQRSNAR